MMMRADFRHFADYLRHDHAAAAVVVFHFSLIIAALRLIFSCDFA